MRLGTSSQEYWQEQTVNALEKAKDTPSANFRLTTFTTQERAVLSLEKTLKAEHEEQSPELQGFAADLLNTAMSEVNWHEIAQHLVSQMAVEA